MLLQAPAGLDDFDHNEGALRTKFQTLWNSRSRNDGYLGYFVAAAAQLPNYVDPRDKPPPTDPVPVPWNGFPKAMSNWFGDETSDAAREQAEAAADTLGYLVYWVQPDPEDPTRLVTLSCPSHQMPFFASVYGDHVLKLARSRCIVLPNGKVSPPFLEQYRQQDEYLEWHADRDANGKLTALTFTAEPPDYWEALAQVSPAKVLALYKSLVSSQVKEEDLFFQGDVVAAGIDQNGNARWYRTPQRKGDYNPLNVWTTSQGAMHLTHPANTLGAEVNLAKDASAVRDCDPLPPPTQAEPRAEVRRIACGGYGGINRSSDPLIGLGVGRTVFGANGKKLTLTDPVGLYIANFDIASLRGPNGEVIDRTVVRGKDDQSEPRMVRIRVAAPDGAAFTLGDCKLGTRALTRGGQIARLTTMALYVQTYDDAADQTSAKCKGPPCRNPTHPNLFIAGNSQGCPAPDDVAWLLETPYLTTTNFAFEGAEKFFKVLKEAGHTDFFSGTAPLAQHDDKPLELLADGPMATAPMPSRAPYKY
ncbi:MAG: hypothetical protein JWR80_1825 [Bradyrhizobium sp.]|nr:hypothetical protein [Bradyrhizobium sp.]